MSGSGCGIEYAGLQCATYLPNEVGDGMFALGRSGDTELAGVGTLMIWDDGKPGFSGKQRAPLTRVKDCLIWWHT